MTVTRRARRARTAALALALVAGSGGAIAMAAASPATAATQTISIENVAYGCTADNAVVSGVLGGTQQVTVKATSTVPDQVAAGGTIASTQANLTLTLSEPFVTKLRDTPGIMTERVKGTATSNVNLTAVGAGNAVAARAGAPVNGLAVKDFVDIPPSGTLDLPAVGTIPDVQVPAGLNGIAYITMPKTFKLQSTIEPKVLGRIGDVALTCVRNSSDVGQRIIGKVTVGDGCPAGSTCEFSAQPDTDPAIPSGGTPTTAPPTGGSTDDPTSPTDDPTDGTGDADDPSGTGSAGGSGGGFVVGASQVAPARTVAASDELPATGSPVGWLAAAAVLLLAAGRVGMSLRERRAAGE